MTGEHPVPDERKRSEIDAAAADEALDDFLTRSSEDKPAEAHAELVETQTYLLRAIYRELRHGHDQVAEHTAALRAHTKALSENTAMMDDLYRALLDNGDRVGRAGRR